MKIQLHAVGKRMPAWVSLGYNEYAKRLSGECSLVLKEVSAGKHSKNASTQQIIDAQGVRLISSLPHRAHVVALDVNGTHWSTEQLAKIMSIWMHQGKDISLLIGGPEGLSENCLQRADQRWSLSALTFPHPLVRIILAEQLYRAYSIIKNHPYHRAG